MAVTLQDFRDAWADKPNRDAALALAEQWVEENRATFEPIFGGKSSSELVAIIDAARLAGNEDVVTAATIWELVGFDRKNIGGTVRSIPNLEPARRKPEGGDAS